ncbi:MAG TPA: cell wall hydrolase [Candidatus Eisenbergiella merdipullorum]|uniref:Cell wall hydrolase n=1 Tax=Candidatus Eisenbergiella merdipullorum TaxID=2838553 RepID=A0A9D2I7I7_9FIRM|nr:cell wall hydrolase [Candidatus Eisenbergiella merdipullorum]
MNTNGRRLWMHAAGMFTGILFLGMACETTVFANGVVPTDTSGQVNVQQEAVQTDMTQAAAAQAAAAQAAAAQAAAAQAAAAQAAAAAARTAMEDAILAQNGVSRQEYDLLAALIQCEAGGESYIGQVAVGNVVMNRVESANHPNTISEVIYAAGQFSPVRNGSLSRTLNSGNVSASCRQAALEAIAGSEPVGDKLYFRRVNGRSGQVIGNHVFY